MSYILLLVSLAVGVVATDSHIPFANATGISWTPSTTAQSSCDPATFAFDDTIDPADWRECAALYSAWGAENGTFSVVNVDGKTYVPVLRQRDCTLAVEPADAKNSTYKIGNQDIEALLDNSLKNFSHGTLLAVGGVVNCDIDGGGRASLAWHISKSK